MRINDIVKLQVYMNANGKDYDVVKELLGGVKKEDEENEDKVGLNVKKAIKDIVELNGGGQDINAPRTPMWDSGFYTKREPIMSDEEFEKAIVALAVEYAEKSIEIGNSGKSASMINRELFDFGQKFTNGKKAILEMQFVSVVSPDRKAVLAKADFTNTYSVYGNEKNIFGGNEIMQWSNQSG